MRRRQIGIVGAVLLAATPATAQAKPIVPGATPLWMALASNTPNPPCPSPRALNGTGKFAALRVFARAPERKQDPFALSLLLSENEALVGYCDPDALAARRLPAPFTGDIAFETTDQAWWGQRLIDGAPVDGGPNGLRPGDRVTLPTGSARAVVDVAVAAGSAARTVRLAATGQPLTSITITGTVAAPTVVTTDAAGVQSSTPVTTVAAAPLKVRALRKGRTAQLRLTGRPNSFVLIDAAKSTFTTLGASGRRTLTITVGRRAKPTFGVATITPEARETRVMRCRFSGRRAACGTPSVRPGALTEFSGLRRARRAAVQPSRAARPSGGAARATPIAPTSVVRISATDGNTWIRSRLVRGDVNLDGRPDAVLADSGDENAELVLVSTGEGQWQPVPLRSERGNSESRVVGDVDGDGRPDLRADSGQIVTNALLGPIPASVDLRKTRQPSDTDIVPPPVESERDLFSFTGWLDPDQALGDVTGDGRPETLFGGDSVFTFASESLPRGRELRLATITSYAEWMPSAATQGGLFIGDEDTELADARRTLSTYAIAGRLFTIEPRDRAANGTAARPVDLVERAADGRALASRSLTVEGWPQLLDVDPATGDALVRLRSATPCKRLSAPGCRERLLRVDASGAVTAAFQVTRAPQTSPSGRFIDDTSDGDDRAELVFSLGDGLNSAGIALASSEIRGTTRLTRLPMLSLGTGRDPEWATSVDVARTADGRRWLATQTSPTWIEGGKIPPNELLLIQPR